VLEAMEDNLAGHFSFLPGLTEGMLVEEEPDLVLVDSDLPTDTFNAVCRARLGRDSAAHRGSIHALPTEEPAVLLVGWPPL
jgi:hypothetical protein